jgi:hypothetical protein
VRSAPDSVAILLDAARQALAAGKPSDAETLSRTALSYLDARSLAGAEATDVLVEAVQKQGRFSETRVLAETALRI